ncbi:long chain base biosynthesis protein 1 isoform X2 [Cinnamomum micranthum f. kanehirae]|uniref:Long chain base biosynthesis protein 1 isoform X2 n=1 Tax=Cinnamomum micranthum f. kanehirae TaxID=337451 RepID=A0A3S3Q2R6_9MAGN|nr:long chain base biosynthesis protein 1 isoform X2 [Cinnamomum micranthum f. kanehirae]
MYMILRRKEVQFVAYSSDWLEVAFDAPLARAVIFGVHIGGRASCCGGPSCGSHHFSAFSKELQAPKRPLTEKEIDELCEEWVPESLHPPITEKMEYEPPILESAAGLHTVIDGKDVVNFASANYLGLDSCTMSLEKYGVGSCGPHGFYGTIVSLVQEIIVFLNRYVDQTRPLDGRVDHETPWNSGQITPLDVIIRLKEKYRFRVVLDESNSFGVLGSSGRDRKNRDYNCCYGPIDVLEEHPSLLTKLKESVALLWKGIRMFVSASHSDSDLLNGSEALKRAATYVLLNHD